MRTALRPLVAPAVVGAARVALGLLWLIPEGLFKFHAGFGAADILVVAKAGENNARVPEYFDLFAHATLAQAPGLFGVGIPLLETGLGVALILGILTRSAALLSLLTLLLYWSSDQLTWEYPLMAALSVVVVAWPAQARAFSVTALAERLTPRLLRLPPSLRTWL
ncbi:hypothetical protein DOE76_17095 [Leifsonia sp. ku-ls]|nr:hypothetical protein DOE76_17095 [Leifsonia sp. ku-ls]